MTKPMVPSLRFVEKGFKGYLAGGGEHGIEITMGMDNAPVTRPMCMNVEHYFSLSCGEGLFVPRYRAETKTEILSDRSLEVSILPYEEWRLQTVVRFTLLQERLIEARYTFSFETSHTFFEAFISNYFHEPTPPYIHVGGRWVQADIKDNEHRWWPKGDKQAAALPEIFERNPMPPAGGDAERNVDAARYDHAIMISPIRDTGWAVLNMVDPGSCAGISANTIWQAHDFSLVGRAVVSGETVQCRAWLAYEKVESPEAALSIYEKLIEKTP